jgi:hypothetical protein
MGVERAVTRWYVQRQALLEEIARLETQLASVPPANQQNESKPVQEDMDVVQQLVQAQTKLRLLGPCPKPMMG